MNEIKHLQSVILLIIKDINQLCQNNNIDYYLLGGSCIGAVRHKGFIPWDDDLDIIMTRDNYERFIDVCKTQLDTSKYVLQEGGKDWPLCFSKIRLKGTYLHEPEDDYADKNMHGIYVDIFYMDNVPDNNILARLQYAFAKFYLCYQLSVRSYKRTNLKKKLMIALSLPLRIGVIRKMVVSYIESFNKSNTNRVGFFYGRTRYKNSITEKKVYGEPIYVPFEDTELPIPEYYDEYLTQMFGNYMQLPPLEQRKGIHLISVDFGNY